MQQGTELMYCTRHLGGSAAADTNNHILPRRNNVTRTWNTAMEMNSIVKATVGQVNKVSAGTRGEVGAAACE